MIKLFFIFLFVLSIPIAYAIYGGESYTQTIEHCENNITILINGSRMIDTDEFSINDNCSILTRGIYNNTYTCNCSNNWLFNLTTKINTINNYNIIFNFNHTQTETPPDTSTDTTHTSSGSSGGGLPPICLNWTKCVNNKTIRLCQKGSSIYNQTKSCVGNITYGEQVLINLTNQTINLIKEDEPINTVDPNFPPDYNATITQEPKKESNLWIWIVGGFFVLLAIIAIFYIVYLMV